MLDLFAPDAVYRRPGYDPLHGRDELNDFYPNQRVIASGRHTITTIVCGDDQVAVEGTFTGMLRTVAKASLQFADFYPFSGSTFAERTTYFYVHW